MEFGRHQRKALGDGPHPLRGSRGSIPTRLRLNPRFVDPRRQGHRGQAVAELTIILPVFVLLLLVALDFGRMFFSYIEVSNAAREGASYGAGNPTDTAGITTYAQAERNAQSQAGETPIAVSASCRDQSGDPLTGGCAVAAGGGGTGNSITVLVTEQFNFLTPLIGAIFSPFNISASASSAVLSLAADGSGTGSGCSTLPTASFTAVVSGRDVIVDASASTPGTGTCAISGYNWEMGDALDPDPPVVGRIVSYTYATDGTYDITLQVTNPASPVNGVTTTLTVTIGSPAPTPTPAPSPTPSPTPAPTPTQGPTCNYIPTFTYAFTGQGNGSKKHQMTFYGAYTGQPVPSTWSWVFGTVAPDSGTGSGQTVSYNYNNAHDAPGMLVTLTIHSALCSGATVSQMVVVP